MSTAKVMFLLLVVLLSFCEARHLRTENLHSNDKKDEVNAQADTIEQQERRQDDLPGVWGRGLFEDESSNSAVDEELDAFSNNKKREDGGPPGLWGRSLGAKDTLNEGPLGLWGRDLKGGGHGLWGREFKNGPPGAPGLWGRQIGESGPPGLWGRGIESDPPGLWGREVQGPPAGLWGREVESTNTDEHNEALEKSVMEARSIDDDADEDAARMWNEA